MIKIHEDKRGGLLLVREPVHSTRMKSTFAPLSETRSQRPGSATRRVVRTCASLAVLLATLLWCATAQADPRRTTRPVPRDSKTVTEAKSVQRPAPEQRRRLITFNERFYPGMGRTFTTWW